MNLPKGRQPSCESSGVEAQGHLRGADGTRAHADPPRSELAGDPEGVPSAGRQALPIYDVIEALVDVLRRSDPEYVESHAGVTQCTDDEWNDAIQIGEDALEELAREPVEVVFACCYNALKDGHAITCTAANVKGSL